MESGHALRIFRMWAQFWEAGVGATATDSSETGKTRRLVWKAYYDTLSTILQRDLRYSPASTNLEPQLLDPSEKLPTGEHLASRIQQRAELKRVETTYESLLLKETRFPKASESSIVIELWVDAVMSNWRVLCGPLWQDEELGEGGKGGVGRGVLDVSIDLFKLIRNHTGYQNEVSHSCNRFSIAQQQSLSIQQKSYGTYSQFMLLWPNLSLRLKRMIPTWR